MLACNECFDQRQPVLAPIKNKVPPEAVFSRTWIGFLAVFSKQLLANTRSVVMFQWWFMVLYLGDVTFARNPHIAGLMYSVQGSGWHVTGILLLGNPGLDSQ